VAEKLDGVALGAIFVGSGLLYAGVKGKSVPSLIQGFVQGKAPAAATAAPGANLAPAPAASPATGSSAPLANASQISSDAMKYQGAGYVWGGAPAKGAGNWDCSSFVNWVCGHDLGLPIPGYPAGSYTGASHGPTTLVWLAWSGLETVSHDGSTAAPGDLAIWQTHMGIVTGPNQMISAQDPANGTGVSAINGFIPGELLSIRRYKATTGSVVPGG